MKAIIVATKKVENLTREFGNIPKSLIPVANNSILEVQLNILHAVGIDDVVVIKGYKEEMINIPGVRYYNHQFRENDNFMKSLSVITAELTDEFILITAGDMLFNKSALEKIIDANSDICLAKVVSENNALEGLIHFSKEGTERLLTYLKHLEVLSIAYEKQDLAIILKNLEGLGTSLNEIKESNLCSLLDNNVEYKKFVKRENNLSDVIGMQTDWALRSKMYDNIQWVNVNETLDAMIELSNLPNNKTGASILDVGVGTGKVLKYFNSVFRDMKCYGIDISNEMMNKIEEDLCFHLSTQNVEDLRLFEDNKFDVVAARMSMHHVDNLNQAIQEIKRVLKPEGTFVICEGVPPTKETLDFYKEVFSYKETRNTFLTDDLINMLTENDFNKVTTRTIVVKDMSMNNWLVNAGIPFRNIDIIRQLHYNAPLYIKDSYQMEVLEDDILMTWKFAVVSGVK